MAKSIDLRILDGTRNLLRYGSFRHPAFERQQRTAPKLPEHLKAVVEEIRQVRHHDARRLTELLAAHETELLDYERAKLLCFSHHNAGNLTRAAALAEQLPSDTLSAHERSRIDTILYDKKALDRLRNGRDPINLPDPTPPPGNATGEKPRALYLAASSMPFILSGYTRRSEAIVEALRASDRFNIFPVTRPGFPRDRSDALGLREARANLAHFDWLDCAADYHGNLGRYLEEAIPALEVYARDAGITLVHGVSNFRNAITGYALARRMGVPFIYEIRGLWEETTDTKMAGWRETERFEFERRFEQYLYRAADGVLVINSQVRSVLEEEPRDNVALLPNCVPRASIRTRERRARHGNGKLRVGYIGSLLEYEGLDDTIRALAMAKREGLRFRFDIFGKGPHRDMLEATARECGVARAVRFHGLVAPKKVPALYDRFDCVIFARKPYRVCQLVTPIKPVEAMANDVNCLLSDVAPLVEISRNGGALYFASGNVEALAQAIATFAAMPEVERADLRQRAREEVLERFTWESRRSQVADLYERAIGGRGTSRKG